MFRYKLRTLLILLAILPPLLWIGWTKYEAWKAEWERQQQSESVLPTNEQLRARALQIILQKVDADEAAKQAAESP